MQVGIFKAIGDQRIRNRAPCKTCGGGECRTGKCDWFPRHSKGRAGGVEACPVSTAYWLARRGELLFS